jgi:hypothetical protein
MPKAKPDSREEKAMTEHETLIYGGFVFMIVIFLISRIGSRKPELPKRPEPLRPEQRPPEVAGQFDSASLQTARGMVSELERHPDSTGRTLALAEMLHRQKQYEARQADRQWQEQQKEADAFDRILAIADRISGRSPSYRPEYPGRINDWHSRREIPETGQWRP